MPKKKEFEHGGARENAGRKAQFNEPTKVIRVPESQVNFIKNWLLNNVKTNNLTDFNSKLNVQQVHPNNDKIYHIPLATERVAAGFPSPAQDDIEQALDLNEYLIRNENATFIVKANSLSMLDAGIDINDPLIVDRSIPAKSGDIVIALIDNDFTVKRLMIDTQFQPPKVWLKAENPDYQNIYIEEGQELVIWGVVTYNLKRMR
ncbi:MULTISPECIES: LexA family protein [Acinetobacter calcoaceticus/baumannii complex]|uniref:Translesion error-prone DNA polymerase V autoproteolytic subunit n=3 Tax=Acinetobacter calcoaceticus/baumannii complex TaxID=909768 RepID=A0AB35JZK5_9GAMM|nr:MULTISPECIES: translesion error-prone DNA polymerase V autoproteolytic subunit [Acinetobacter calcoaceticus/baumannii complex]MBJ8436525.1 translesion error-prone DNA polymerase V autoproteolytic subunit [Acinetobacter lactucae]MCG9493360.1 translesion error-prone DNA polymerase V autoproteolytic subunit [Acinetobacter pittii]MCG9512809.1 translesion error-prone DNA polymerase V autoproteolytic subunit [Acinetobacter pittii]MDD9320812.1 translesion error-prone DNA polymerase V autoproteolyti